VVESAMGTKVVGQGKLASQAKLGETDCKRKVDLSRVRSQIGQVRKRNAND
jgi:hypothetical protein